VQGLQDHLLLAHGMVDDNVLFQDTVRLVQALLEAGKDFDVMFYPRGTHGLTRRQETFSDLMRRSARFFAQHMGLGPGRGEKPEPSGPSAMETTEARDVVAYRCGVAGQVIASFGVEDREVVLSLAGDSVTLTRRPSASGLRFSDGDVVLWTKDDGALLERGGRVDRCEEDHRRTLIERARLAGTEFWAAGDEPGWELAIRSGRVVLSTDYGLRPLEAPIAGTEVEPDTGSTVYRAVSGSRKIEITVGVEECTKTTDDGVPETSVVVAVDGVLHRGCGLALH
jgi:membrane-bound inhibitor of C-type lysozyme/uncharacterized membrane protein